MIDRERLRPLATIMFFVMANLVAMGAFVAAEMPAPTTVYADEVTIDVGVPTKGVAGNDGIACTGKATQDGHTLTYTNYVGADAGEMSSNPDKERSWQSDYCRWMLEQDMGGWFKYQHNVTLDPSNIKITIRRL
jgi:hypothetical protein